LFYLTILISSDYDVYGICSQFLVLGQAPKWSDATIEMIQAGTKGQARLVDLLLGTS